MYYAVVWFNVKWGFCKLYNILLNEFDKKKFIRSTYVIVSSF